MTRREQIIELISEQALPMQEIASNLKVDIKKVITDMHYISQYVRPKKVVMVPPTCRACGYVFHSRRRQKTPTKCPACKGERIEPGKFVIK